MTVWKVVDTAQQYQDSIERLLAGKGPLALDAERASGFRYSQRAYLIQMFREGAGVVLVDPIAIQDFSDLSGALQDQEWIIHASMQDLVCLREVGLDPVTLFDTELASRLLGLPRVKLALVVEHFLGVALAKEYSAVDWSIRPLEQSWLSYAAEDVMFLPKLRDALYQEALLAGKEEILRQEFVYALKRPLGIAKKEPWKKLSRSLRNEDVRQYAVLKRLWFAREAQAQQQDLPPSKILSDVLLLLIAKHLPVSQEECLEITSGRLSVSEDYIEVWMEAIEQGRNDPVEPSDEKVGEAIPPGVRVWKDQKPRQHEYFMAARDRLREVAQRENIPVENLLEQKILKLLCWGWDGHSDSATYLWLRQKLADLGARQWQINMLTSELVELFCLPNVKK